jgi:hypothetical protein
VQASQLTIVECRSIVTSCAARDAAAGPHGT